ncbi:hypothetical protein [Agrococcus sp. Ld7]|uniref:hypothetical protein n=1 Tax=Agrococcus sp. Ld7 TaxID=649148 RepID=UPI0038648518
MNANQKGTARALPWGFHLAELVAPIDSLLTDLQAELIRQVSLALGDDDEGLAYLDNDDIRDFVASVAEWYSMHYGRPAADSQEYTLEVEGIAALIAPHVVDVPESIQQRARGVTCARVPFPSAAHVLGFEL